MATVGAPADILSKTTARANRILLTVQLMEERRLMEIPLYVHALLATVALVMMLPILPVLSVTKTNTRIQLEVGPAQIAQPTLLQ